LASAGHVLYHQIFDLSRFQLTPHTTYDAYVYAVNSNRVESLQLLPPEFPCIRVFFKYMHPNRRVHFSCPRGERSWKGYFELLFETVATAVHDLVLHRYIYWCEHCDKPLFFSCSCGEVAE
jgi:hypothetical protein